jgi:hypothetical protein
MSEEDPYEREPAARPQRDGPIEIQALWNQTSYFDYTLG